MEQETRNALQKATQRIRRILEDEFAEQLEGTFDILASGKILPQAGAHLNARQVLTRQKLVDAIEHIRAGGRTPQEAVQQYTRESAFTFLNRFVALRMLESRGMLQECVSKGDQSAGFREFCGLAPGLAALEDGGYRLYLECLFDELSVEIKVLFDRRDSASLLWPRRGSLTGVLEVLQQRELAGVWSEDETIGWVYQYYNDEAERKQMRAESAAPRNSRELAVRNQFFTPRYVVEFLTDNTLGRIWYEMNRGQTVLRDRCRYLVRRPAEIFLQPGETAPESTANGEQNTVANLSQEELLRQPVYIPHRALKDPREIRLLDPACGSMHFGLYAFDLFTAIWEEAWEIANGQNEVLKTEDTFARFVEFASTFADKTTFLREVPRLIIQHNIHGIDIDPRAAQIANLSIWLRAQRSWHQLGTKWTDRPRILRSNIVCAEPMPGEKSLLREFIEQHFREDERPAFAFLLERIFDRMTLAGEAGSLLRIEEEIRTAIGEAHTLAIKQSAKRQKQLFDEDSPSGIEEREFDLRALNQEEFWHAAEQRIYHALEAYAERAESGDGFQRRLFVNDAAQGFALIELCNKRYDVVVMNPPFGEASVGSRRYLYTAIKSSTQDLFAAFVERFASSLTTGGRMGILSNRLALFKDLLTEWRKKVILGTISSLLTVADLGYGVLDAAVVEAAAYVVEKSRRAADEIQSSFFTVLDATDKDNELLNTIILHQNDKNNRRVFIHRLDSFTKLPNKIIAFWCSDSWLQRIAQHPSAAANGVVSKKGLETGDDCRLLRLIWEVDSEEFSPLEKWTPYSKGGDYRPLHADLHLAFDYRRRALARRNSNAELYGSPGLTYTERTTSNFAARVLPGHSVFSPTGPGIFISGIKQLWGLLGFLNSSAVGFFIELFVGGGRYFRSRHCRSTLFSFTDRSPSGAGFVSRPAGFNQ